MEKLSFQDQIDFTNRSNRFMRHCGIRITELNESVCRAEASVTPDLKNTGEYVHGGLMFTLADCTVSCFARGLAGTSVTLNSDFRFLKNVTGGILRCVAEPVKIGRTVLTFHVRVLSETDDLLADGTFSCYHREEREA